MSRSFPVWWFIIMLYHSSPFDSEISSGVFPEASFSKMFAR